MRMLFSNFAKTKIPNTLASATTTTIRLEDPTNFPIAVPNVSFYYAVFAPADGSEEGLEIVAVTNGPTYNESGGYYQVTVKRGLFGTTPFRWTAGSKFELRLIADVMQQLSDTSGINWIVP